MKLHFGNSKQIFPDGKEVKYKELQVWIDDNVFFSFRRYPSKTYVQYHNSYKGFSKTLFKMYHREADESVASMLEFIKRQYKLSWSGNEFESIMDAYNKMKVMKI